MQAFELAEYHWERTFLYLDFADGMALSPHDKIVLRGMRYDPEIDSEPKESCVPMTGCYVEGERRIRVRFMLGDRGNPVRSGDYQLFVWHRGDEYPIFATEEQVHPQSTSNKRGDVLLYAKTSSFYEVIPLVVAGQLYCTVESKRMPPQFGYQPKLRLERARANHIQEIINYGAVKTFDFFKRHAPRKSNKVLFTSDSRIDLSGNMEPLYERMVERGLDRDCKIVFAFKNPKTGVTQSRTPLSYLRLSYHLATSRVVFCDDYQSYLYHVHYPAGTHLVQLWHACGHFKTVGWGRIGTLDAIAPFTNDHRNYTDVIVASESDVPIYGEAFGVLDECVKPLGIPRHDWLVDEGWQRAKRERFAELFPQAAGKRVIMFAPTFRGAGKKVARYDFDKIDYATLEEFCREHGFFFVFKMHPFIPDVPALPEGSEDVFADASSVREINDLLPATDILVTDYSSVVYEAALLDIPTLYYAYDLEDYISSRSFYEPFEQFVSGKIVRTFDELLASIAAGDFATDLLEEFRRKNFKYLDGGACDRIIDEIVIPAMEGSGELTAADVRVISLSQDAAAVNAELDGCEEQFVMFVDDKAKYGPDYIEGVLSAFQGDSDLGIASGLILNHRGKPLSNEVDTSDKVIRHDAAERFSKCVLLPYGAIYRKSFIEEAALRFDEDLQYCRDELFAIRYAELFPKSVRVNRYTYRTAKVLDETGTKTPQSYEERWYTDSTLPLLAKLGGQGQRKISRVAQFGLLYLTIQRFKSNQGGLIKMAFDSPEQTEEYLAQVGEVMRHIDDEVLFCRANAVSWQRYKRIYLAQLRNPDVPLEFEVKKVVGNPALLTKVSLSRVTDARLTLKGGSGVELCRMGELRCAVMSMERAVDEQGRVGLDMRIRLARCFPVGSFTLVARNTWGGEKHDFPAVWETTVAGIVTFFDYYACRQDAFHVFVPLASDAVEQKITLFAQFDGFRVEKNIEFGNGFWANKLSTNDDYGYWYFDGMIARSAGGVIVLAPATEQDRAAAEARYQGFLDRRAASAEEAAAAKPKSNKLAKDAANARAVADLRRAYWETFDEFAGRTIWTYYDKSYKAGDNAEYALRYAAAQDDGIEKVFFIDPACKDAKRLRDEGYTVLDPATVEGELYALHASIVHMTHVPAFLKLGLGPNRIAFFRDLIDAKVVRMYHGYPITRSASYAQVSDNCSGVVIASGYERDLYTNDDNGYAPGQVIESGMPRYDDLVDDSRRQILFAPTWRPALVGKSLGGGVSDYNPAFKESEFYRSYAKAMSDERLLEACRRKGYKIKMFLHPKMNAQTRDFEANDVVEALSCTEDIDYVTIMRQSDLMVTDYSSVQYDFAYMRKPVVYYQDPKLPYWRLVDFDYEGIGFGEVCDSVESLVSTLVSYIEADCALKDGYRARIEDFFIHDDRESGRRLYEADLALQKAARPVARLNPGDLSKARGL